MKTKVKGKKLTPKQIKYIAQKFGIEPEQVRDVIKEVGNSRSAIYENIKDNVC